MSAKSLVQDALALLDGQRFDSAFCLALISVEAAAFLRYGDQKSAKFIKSSSKRFKQFLNDETKTHKVRMKHAVDMPPLPEVGPPPEFEPPDDRESFGQEIERWKSEYDRWQNEHHQAYESFRQKFQDVGDAFKGEFKKSKKGKLEWVSYLSQPRLVTTTGILYQARCDIVHEGKLSSIRLTPVDDQSLGVAGADPIEFSASWVRYVLAIAANSSEMQALLRSPA
ncbi:MAG: hypothetical protein KKB50_00770 [Planctomycetes bacterium]|nr:hypothetical protein [Planctomycetota bacterium]